MDRWIDGLRRLVALGVLLPLLFAASPAALAQTSPHDQEIDLASIALTTPDLEEAGFEDYALFAGTPYGTEDLSDTIASLQNIAPDDFEETLDDAGFEGSFILWYQTPAVLDEGADMPDREVVTTVHLFEDADGAADAWEVIADESQMFLSEEPEDAGQGLGDASELTILTPSQHPYYGGVTFTQLELEILFERMVLEVSLYVFDGPTAGELEPDEADVRNLESLGERYLERAEAAADDGAPNLSPRIMVLESDISLPPNRVYRFLDGDGVRMTYETEESYAGRVSTHEDEGIVFSLRNEQYLTDYTSGVPLARFFSSIQVFTDEDAASDYLAGHADRFGENPMWQEIEVTDLAGFGDEANAVTLTGERSNGDSVVLNEIFIRHGDTVGVFWFETSLATDAETAVSIDTLSELVETQAECLAEHACAEREVSMPRGIEDFVEYVLDGA